MLERILLSLPALYQRADNRKYAGLEDQSQVDQLSPAEPEAQLRILILQRLGQQVGPIPTALRRIQRSREKMVLHHRFHVLQSIPITTVDMAEKLMPVHEQKVEFIPEQLWPMELSVSRPAAAAAVDQDIVA